MDVSVNVVGYVTGGEWCRWRCYGAVFCGTWRMLRLLSLEWQGLGWVRDEADAGDES